MRSVQRSVAVMATALVLGVGFVAAPRTAYAQAPAAGAPGEEKKVTLNLKDVPLRNAIELLFAGSGLQYQIQPNVPNIPINVTLRDIGLTQALRLMVRQAAVAVPGLSYNRDGEIYTIQIRPPIAPGPMTTDIPPPEETLATAEITWEKIPVQYNSIQVLAFAGLVQSIIPTEGQLMGGMGMMGGMGGMGGGMGGGMMGGMGGGMMGGMGGGMMGGMGGGMMGGMGGGMGGMMGGMGGMGGGMGGMGGGMGGMGGGMMGGGGMGGFGGGGMGGGMGGGGGRRF